jgi:hypothetical protein
MGIIISIGLRTDLGVYTFAYPHDPVESIGFSMECSNIINQYKKYYLSLQLYIYTSISINISINR